MICSALPGRRMLFFVILTASAGGASDQSSGVSLHIETESGRMQFRIGEAIRLKLTFVNLSSDPWMVTITGRDRSILALRRDQFLVSPSTGTSDPLRFRFSEGIAYSGPGGMYLREQTTVAHLDLNQWVRFERPGRYHLSGLFHATGTQRQDLPLNSNEIEIEIVPAEAEWLAQELRQDVAVLNAVPAKPDNQTGEARMDAARRIWYLDTPESVREAGLLLGTADIQVSQILQMGLRASQHPEVAITAMKQLLRNVDQPVTPMFIETLAMIEASVSDPDARRRYELRASIAEQLRTELAAVIEQKRASARAISLKTVVDNMSPESVPAELRAEVASVFGELPADQQSALLGGEWEKITGPEMIPVLRQIYDAAPETASQAPSMIATAVERLYELDPVQARTLILEEMKRPIPRLPFRTLAILPDATLPALDQILMDHLEHSRERETEELIARYATASILDRVKTFYAKLDAAIRVRTSANIPDIRSTACEPALVAYFLRVDPAWGEHVLRDSLTERSYPMGRCWMGILGRTASYYVSPAWEKIAVEALQDPTVVVKADAVKALGQYGSAAAKGPVWESFRYWHDWWKDRSAELNDENRRFEQVFLEATAHPKNWIATDEDLEKIRDLCITLACSGQAEQYRRKR